MENRGLHIFIRHSAKDILNKIIDTSETVADLRKNLEEYCEMLSPDGILSVVKELAYWKWEMVHKKTDNVE